MPRTFVMGDIHGHYEVLLTLLKQVGLIDQQQAWSGGDAALWFIGDFFDRGPEGVSVLDLVIRLQEQAPHTGGKVGAILGNHDVLVMAARQFGNHTLHYFVDSWIRNGGRTSDLARLSPAHIAWLSTLPAAELLGDTLLIHADSPFYARYGRNLTTLNTAFWYILSSDDPDLWEGLLDAFSEHRAFLTMELPHIKKYLDQYGARRMIHGHSPIAYCTGEPPDSITKPLIYADGMCINIDSGIYMGGSGFIYEMDYNDEPD
jgi:hypothetical protein